MTRGRVHRRGRPAIAAVIGAFVLTAGGAASGFSPPSDRHGADLPSDLAGARPPQDSSPQRGEAGRGVSEQRTVQGRALGPDGGPVSRLEVLLHRVTNQGGAQLARSLTGEDGRFTLRYMPPGDADGVYFVAARYDGRVYVGPMLRPPFQDVGDYVMQVGVPGVGDIEAFGRARLDAARPSAASPPASGFSSGRPPAPGAVFVAAMLSAAIAIGAMLAVRGTGPARRRRALIGLAELDEAALSDAPPSAVARRRRALLRRVKEA